MGEVKVVVSLQLDQQDVPWTPSFQEHGETASVGFLFDEGILMLTS